MPTSTGKTLCLYGYDPLDRQTTCAPFDQEAIQRFHCKARLATEVQDAVQRSIVQCEDRLLAERKYEGAKVEIALLATDLQRSVLHALDATSTRLFVYTPYGYRPMVNGVLGLLGFNGECPDRVTGHYHLGNGYRQFNPVLMRLNTPDSWSPFGKGGLNAYAYCEGEPILRSDPDGHSFGSVFTKPLKNIFTSRQSSSSVFKKLLAAEVVYLDGRPIKTLGGFSGDENTLFRVDLNKNQYRKLSKVKLRVDRHTAQMERENFSLVTKSDSDGLGSVPPPDGVGQTNISVRFKYLFGNANNLPMRQLLGSIERMDDAVAANRMLSKPPVSPARTVGSIRQ